MGVSSRKDLPEPAFAPSPPLSASPGTAVGSSDCELDAHTNSRQAAAALRRRPQRINSSPSSLSTSRAASRRRSSPANYKQQSGQEEEVGDGDLGKAFNLIRASWHGRLPADLDSPEWHVLHLSPSQYLALCAKLEDSNPALRRYFDETLRHDYNPARGILVLRLMAGTALHEFLQENTFQFIVTQISQAPARVPELADIALCIKNLGHTKVILDANIEQTVWAYKCPDRQLRYIGTHLPQFAMEVGYSQKAESLQQLAREYYEDSDGEVKTVLTFNVAYTPPEKRGQAADRTASFSLYRGDERIHKDKVFRDAQGKAVASGSLQLHLTDFVPDTVLEQLDEQRRSQAQQYTIDMSSELLNKILEEADKFQTLEDDRLRMVKERREQRRGRDRDAEPHRSHSRWDPNAVSICLTF
ncbi:hypothetical protein UCDDA912_g10623 [Diaporthe ampelina]|uniref:Uncharacterized protein n=1 Tax=Diaporthe ampelina TaxID=1214573 RepID=A0A0G2F3W8_9PEZI|nr:hypothetical protein UCDDA912_g10623 [Diaporthe ampelina]